jgi:hypothetical protein
MAYWTNCADCKYCFGGMGAHDRLYCEASQLSELLDGEPPHHNTVAECNAARDFKVACGHEARWFVAKDTAL